MKCVYYTVTNTQPTEAEPYYIYCRHHHHHYLAIIDFGHLLIRSGLTHPEIYVMVSPGYLLPGIPFI
jgi:hypothetical protein